MSNVLIDDTYLTDIADSIRNKLNVQTRFKPSEMANGIASIPGGNGKRFADIQTTHDVPVNLTPEDFKQGTTLKYESFYVLSSNNDLLAQYIKSIESVIFPEPGVIDIQLKSDRYFNHLFMGSSVKSVYLNGLISSKAKDIGYMFYGCTNLIHVDFGQSDFSNATDMTSMFEGCTALEHIDLSSLDLSNSPILSDMFGGCINLISVIFPSTTKRIQPKNTEGMFYNCNKLQSVTILATTPPTLDESRGNLFNSTQKEQTKVYVPSASVEAYKVANKQSNYADMIRAIPG